jgi:hypothetical protein
MTVKQEWVEVTRYVLVQYAADECTVTYGQLYDRLRAIHFPSWRARSSGNWWVHQYIAPILDELGTMCRRNEEPLLSALVRYVDTGNVGPGYVSSVFRRYDYSPERYIHHSQIETGKCFRHFGTPV